VRFSEPREASGLRRGFAALSKREAMLRERPCCCFFSEAQRRFALTVCQGPRGEASGLSIFWL
jgi:hypothetical protein